MRPVLILAALTLAAPANAFTARNGLEARQIGSTEIEVPFRHVGIETAYWCAAGDYAVRVLKLPNATRIYRASPPPRKQGQGITFTLDPAKAADPGLSIFGKDKSSISLGHATGNFCSLDDVYPFSLFDR